LDTAQDSNFILHGLISLLQSTDPELTNGILC